MIEPMNPAEIAAMAADMQAGTPGPWYVEVLAGEIHDVSGIRIESTFQTASGDYSWDTEITSVICSGGGSGGIATMEDAFRIARVPAMEQTILALQSQLAAMTEARDAAVARVGVLTEALKKIRDVESYVKHESFFGDPGRVDITPYTKTGEIARAALTEGTPDMTDSKSSGVAWRWKPKDGSVWFYDPDPEWLSRQSPDEIDAEQLFLHPGQPDPVGYALAIEQVATLAVEGYDRLAGETWFPDGVASKNDKCSHGIVMYEECVECLTAAIRSLSPPADRLAAVLAMPEVRALVEALECMKGAFDTPISRRRINGGLADEARMMTRAALATLKGE